MFSDPVPLLSAAAFLSIGGTHGHVEEMIDGDLLVLWNFYEWKPIRNCTGRHTCRDNKKKIRQLDDSEFRRPTELDPLELLELAFEDYPSSTDNDNKSYHWQVQEFGPAPGRTDRILVVPLDQNQRTGIITYVKEGTTTTEATTNIQAPIRNRRYVHTLNAPSGFQRKLEAIGIQLLE